MTRLHVLRVFVGQDGQVGNPLGVFLDGRAIAIDRRQAVAHELGFSETVFVDRVETIEAHASIFTPARELPFAGHPTVGTSWLLRQEGHPVERLVIPAGKVDVWQRDDLAWIRARASWAHPVTMVEMPDAAAVEALTGPPEGFDSYYPWAWIDEGAGDIRSRYFAAAVGIAEDEATGLAAVVIGDMLRRPLTIHQGVGSELHVRPGPDGTVEVGGRVALDDVRDWDHT